jgi:hypothetical protein
MKSLPSYYKVTRFRGFWCPSRRMRQQGFASVACGEDGNEARALAESWNEKWRAHRTGQSCDGQAPLIPSSHKEVGYIYFLRSGNRVKIGYSRRPFARVSEIRTGMHSAVDSYVFVRGTPADEKKLHRRLAAYRTSGEWFALSGNVKRVMIRSLADGAPHHETSAIENENETSVGTFPL